MASERVTRKSKFPKVEEMTKDQIRKTIIKKREATGQAQRVVESLLEPGASEELLLRSLPLLNKSHLDDVVEERAIMFACGYPPCANRLPQDIPKQKYRISMRTNKVYDITARKSFCSNWCYKATVHIKKQMLTSPLWFREYEELPTFQLMPPDAVPSMGQEIDLSIIEKIHIKEERCQFTSINEFASASISDIDGTEDSLKTVLTQSESVTNSSHNNSSKYNLQASSEINLENSKQIAQTTAQALALQQITERQDNVTSHLQNKAEQITQDKGPCPADSKQSKQKVKVGTNNHLNIVGEVIEHPEKKIDLIITSAKSEAKEKLKSTPKNTELLKTEDTMASLIIHVEKCVAEWFTLDSMIFLFGETKVKEMVADKGDCIKEYLNNMANGLFYSSTSYDQYQQLCRKLNMLELEDHRYDSKVINKETKPLPDYSIIKEEGKKMELKVRAFLSGEFEVPEPKIVVETQPQEQDPSNLTQLPLVDKKAQNALRRKILLTNLNRVLHDLQRSIGLQGFNIASDVRLLVNSFKLKANNIMFKPIQWTLIGIIVIKLLSLRDLKMQQALECPAADRNLQLLLLSYKQEGGYLDRLLLWLTDFDRLLDTSDTQLTVNLH